VRVHLGLNETKKVIVRDGWLGDEDWLLETKKEKTYWAKVEAF
jgi:hypothetical protein